MQFIERGMRRRSFLARASATAIALTGLGVGGSPRALEGESATAQGTVPDERWLRNLRGKHKIAFDVEAHRNGHALAQAQSFLDAYEREYGVPARDVSLVMGVRGTGLPIVFTDAIWARYRLGEQYSITDPATKAAASRNPYIAANLQANGPVTAAQTVEALQRRGVVFLVCNNTVGSAAKKLAAAGLGEAEVIRAELRAGVLPGAVLVPAMVIAFNRMQERGVSYVFAG